MHMHTFAICMMIMMMMRMQYRGTMYVFVALYLNNTRRQHYRRICMVAQERKRQMVGANLLKPFLTVVFPFFVCVCWPGNLYICIYSSCAEDRCICCCLHYRNTCCFSACAAPITEQRRALYAYLNIWQPIYGLYLVYNTTNELLLPKTFRLCVLFVCVFKCIYLFCFIFPYFIFRRVFSCVHYMVVQRGCVRALFGCFICSFFFKDKDITVCIQICKEFAFFFGIILRGFCKVVLRLCVYNICLYTELRKWKDGYTYC